MNVPTGHHNSDLSSAACNIGLSRRRDITLRQDLKPYVDGKPALLADVFKVRACEVWEEVHHGTRHPWYQPKHDLPGASLCLQWPGISMVHGNDMSTGL